MPDRVFNKELYDIAWDWFQVHANQRMELFRFFILIVLAMSAGYVSALQINQLWPALLISFFGLLTAYIFYHLDGRVSSLIKIGEAALQREQQKASETNGYSEVELVKKADELAKIQLSFRVLFNLMFASVAMISLAGALHSMLRIFSD